MTGGQSQTFDFALFDNSATWYLWPEDWGIAIDTVTVTYVANNTRSHDRILSSADFNIGGYITPLSKLGLLDFAATWLQDREEWVSGIGVVFGE